MEIKGSPSLKIISEDTGIQITRVFRLFNGYEMKLSEYEVFKLKVDEHFSENKEQTKAFSECQKFTSQAAQQEIIDLTLQRTRMAKYLDKDFMNQKYA
jgi:hypothetical protein